jgi:hypothetical protein
VACNTDVAAEPEMAKPKRKCSKKAPAAAAQG